MWSGSIYREIRTRVGTISNAATNSDVKAVSSKNSGTASRGLSGCRKRGARSSDDVRTKLIHVSGEVAH